MAEPLRPGDPRQLGDYYLDGRLGSGGQGVVYDGYGPNGERVAVKALHGVSDRDREMLRKEAWAWRRVAPFCTAKVLHVDLDGPVPFVVSEFVPGPDLRRAVERGGPYGPDGLRRLAIGVATALVGVHRAEVVHRDLKPENILLGPDGPRVIDFGIARMTELPTTTGLVKGTVRYMPPERYRSEHGDAKVDVWGWGAVVLFAATGRHAFDGPALPVIADRIAKHEPDVSMLEEPLRSLVTAALSKDPKDRPESEELLLGLVGGVDLREAEKEAGAGRAPGHVPPSRAELAETVFSCLDVKAQEAVPGVLLRLVAPGEHAESTLRAARRDDFADGRTGPDVLDRVLRDFTEAGILVWEGESVTLAGAALIRAWPRLREWADAERDGLAVHQALAVASRVWDGHERKNGDLYQGTALARALEWAATGRRHLTLNLVERGFLDAAAALDRRRGRLRALLSAVLAVLLVIAVGAAAVAVDQRQTVIGQRDRAVAVQVAGLAESMRRTKPETARRLAVAAARLGHGPETHAALLTARHQWEQDVVDLTDFDVTAADLDGAGRTLVAAGDNRVEVWNVDTRKRTGVYTAPAAVRLIVVSADGGTAAISTADGRTRLLDTARARLRDAHSYPSDRGDHLPRVVLSPRGTYLVIERMDRDETPTATVWDTRTARKIATASGADFPAWSTSFSPNERIMSLPGTDGRPFDWFDTRTNKRIDVPEFGSGARAPVVFSPDGKHAAVKLDGGRFSIFDFDAGYATTYRGLSEVSFYELHFSHDGRYIAEGPNIWDMPLMPHEPVMRYSVTLGECSSETSFRFTPDGSELRCLGSDGAVRSLDVAPFTQPAKPTSEAVYVSATVSRDRSTVAIGSGNDFEFWTGRTRRSAVRVSASGTEALTLSPDGRLFALISDRSRIDIWDTSKGSPVGSLPTAYDRAKGSGTVQRLAFSPDGRSLAAQVRMPDGVNVLTFWDVATGRRLHETRMNTAYDAEDGGAVVFHPDGRSVYAGPGIGRVAFPSGRILTKAPATLRVDDIGDDGRTLYSYPHGARPFIRILDARTLAPAGEELRTGPVSGGTNRLTAVSPDGRLFATGHRSSTGTQIKVWDRDGRKQLGLPLTGPIDDLIALWFTPDGSALVSVDKQGRFHTHAVAPGRLARELCEESGPLTEREWKEHIPHAPYRETC
ncbi:protein kinase domain-containing protein [Actinomadura sediminis]|uniref:non-specific serine/threonine protein kinase n=1 Tax=Actinomadura sediminis TaxID=1038904 RepID=A0ABW3ETT6_9ACTN